MASPRVAADIIPVLFIIRIVKYSFFCYSVSTLIFAKNIQNHVRRK